MTLDGQLLSLLGDKGGLRGLLVQQLFGVPGRGAVGGDPRAKIGVRQAQVVPLAPGRAPIQLPVKGL